MTLGEALVQGLQTTVLGMLTVFAVLVILMIAIAIMKKVFYKPVVTKPVTEQQTAPASAVVETAETDDEDEEELIAVLTAAIAASLNTSTYNLKIKSFRRTDKRTPAWNAAGVKDVINSRF